MITIYVMVSISSAVCSHNMMEILVSLMGYAHLFKTPQNQWGELFADKLPRVADRQRPRIAAQLLLRQFDSVYA